MLLLQSATINRTDINELEMKFKCENMLIRFVVSTVLISQKCYSAVIINSTPIGDEIPHYTPLSTLCSLTEETEGFCVPIRNCMTLLTLLNPADVRARRCGPRNENLTNPFVCCEKIYIQLDANMTSVEKLSTMRPLQQETESVTVFSQPPSSTRPPQQRPSAPWVKSEESPFPKTTTAEAVDEAPFQGCGFQEISSRILGGKPSSQKEFPWLARLLRRDNRGEVIFSCTGALISSRMVLTTAHCLISESLQNLGDLYAVSLGEHDTECNSKASECLLNKKTIMVSKFIPHPGYTLSSRNHDNDIGLVMLRKDVSFSSYISPICLMENGTETTEYHVAGWGKTESHSVSGVKLKAEIPSFSWEQCARKYSSIKIELTTRQICAGGVEGMDSCQGDSGGPLMVNHNMKWYVAGVVSFGLGCGRKGWPAVYAYVPSYIEWIKENVRQNSL